MKRIISKKHRFCCFLAVLRIYILRSQARKSSIKLKEEAFKNRLEEQNARDVSIEKKETELEEKKNALDKKKKYMDELETGLNFQKDELEVRHAAMEEREEEMNQLEQIRFNGWDWEVGIYVQT